MDDNYESRIICSDREQDDLESENILRPKVLSDFVGQDKIKHNLTVFIEAAKMRKEPLDHVLLYGPPGLGKTTLAHIIANEMEGRLKVTSGPAIERAADLAAILTNLDENSVLFIDEIHRLNHNVEEILYPAMEDYVLDMIIGKGPSARTVRIPLQPFTLVGATTRAGLLSSPLRDRFGVISRMELYSPSELQIIIRRSARILNIMIDDDASYEIAIRSRGTPRIANRLLKRVRDFASYQRKDTISLDIAKESLSFLEVDALGLDAVDIRLLQTIIDKFYGGPVGLDTLAAAIGEDPNTIEDIYEPYLLQIGFIARTPRGRVALKRAYAHLNKPLNDAKERQLSIFDTNENE